MRTVPLWMALSLSSGSLLAACDTGDAPDPGPPGRTDAAPTPDAVPPHPTVGQDASHNSNSGNLP